MRRPHPFLRRSAALLSAAALAAATVPALTGAASAAGETAPPAEQDVRAFCTNPYAEPFSDVPADNRFALAISCLATAGVTQGAPDGLGAGAYGPDLGVTRGQMATFTARLLDAADARDRNRDRAGVTYGSQVQQLPAADGSDTFDDVSPASVHGPAIERLAEAGIVLGGAGTSSDTTFSPDAPVSRAQMATFLNRAAAWAMGQDPARAGAGAGYTAPEGADYYTDDEPATAHEANINGITSVGVAVGTGGDTYAPTLTITRAQMAGFLARTLAQLFDDDRVHSLLETWTGHFAPPSREDEQRQVTRDGEATMSVNVRAVQAGFLGPLEYRITLVECANVTRGADDLVRVTPDGTTGFAAAGDVSSRIVAVGTSDQQSPPPAGTTNSVAVQPGANGTIRIDVRNDTEPECVVALLYVNGGEGRTLAEGGTSPRLEVDSEGRPVERFGMSGQTRFLSPDGTDTPLTVMTRNVYLGTDITRPLRPAPEGKDPNIALANQVHEMRRIVGLTDFPARAELLAKEIVQTQPDVIGLQEVATWRKGPFQYPPPQDAEGRVIPNATQVEYDFLRTLLTELREAGEVYDVVSVIAQSDVEAPGFRGDNPFAADAQAADYRLTMHDVMLKRSDSPIVVEASGGENYDAVLPFDLGGYKYEFVRGYNWADIRVGAERVRLLNTHLESQLSSFAYQQAQELVEEQVLPATTPVILTCDCNSDPLDTSTKPGEPIAGISHQDPYLYLRQYLDDAWLETGTDLPGFTSGLNELVDEAPPASFTHRIDLVLTRGVDGAPIPADRPVIVGADPANRTAGGLWPSDHAGVVVRLQP